MFPQPENVRLSIESHTFGPVRDMSWVKPRKESDIPDPLPSESVPGSVRRVFGCRYRRVTLVLRVEEMW